MSVITLVGAHCDSLLCRFSAEAMRRASGGGATAAWRRTCRCASLSEMFNVNYFLVCQTNPHIVPALNLKKRVNRKLGNLLEAEWKHRCARARPVCLALWPLSDTGLLACA